MMKFKLHKWGCYFPESKPSDINPQSVEQENCWFDKPELETLSPMVKRRMPKVAKAMAALDDKTSSHQLPAVYASKNAELSRTLKLIRQFDFDLSPAMFSMSVNNAIPGLLSVVNKNCSPYSVIDSMSGLLPMAFLEASNLLIDHPIVKVVVFEEEGTALFEQQFGGKTPCFASIFVISRGDDFSLELIEKENKSIAIEGVDQGFQLEWLPFFNRNTSQMEQVCRRQLWRWTWL